MSRFEPNHPSLLDIRDSVVVITGGGSGIGASLVRQLYERNCTIVFGDIDEKASNAIVSETSPQSVHFVKCDVCSYADNLRLFNFAWERYGRVDHAIANAGILERPGWFIPNRTIEEINKAEPPPLTTLNINLIGLAYFSNIACTYLTQGHQALDGEHLRDKSLTLVGSLAGWKEIPPLFMYQTSKHGVLGLLRALRLYVPEKFPGLRVNAVCPGMTVTRIVPSAVREQYENNSLPANQPEDIARVIVGLCRAGPGTQAIWYDEAEAPGLRSRESAGGMDWKDVTRGTTGRALFIQGGECYDTEEGLDRTEDLWLGQHVSALLQKVQSNRLD